MKMAAMLYGVIGVLSACIVEGNAVGAEPIILTDKQIAGITAGGITSCSSSGTGSVTCMSGAGAGGGLTDVNATFRIRKTVVINGEMIVDIDRVRMIPRLNF